MLGVNLISYTPRFSELLSIVFVSEYCGFFVSLKLIAEEIIDVTILFNLILILENWFRDWIKKIIWVQVNIYVVWMFLYTTNCEGS